MAYARSQGFEVHDVTGSAVASIHVVFGASVAVGDALVVRTTTEDIASTDTLNDSLANTYVAQDQLTGINGQRDRSLVCFVSHAGTPDLTYAFTPSRAFVGLQGDHFTGTTTASTVRDHQAAKQVNPGTGANAITTPALAAQSGDLAWASTGDPGDGHTTAVSGTGYTGANGVAGGSALGPTEWKTAAGSETPTFTDGTSGGAATYASFAIAITPGTAGGGAAPMLRRRGWGPFRAFARVPMLQNSVSVVALNNYVLTADPGAYALTGQPAQLITARLLNATAGAYTLTGAAANTLAGRVLKAAPGSYTLSGATASLLAARLLKANPGSYVLSGAAAKLLAGRLLNAAAGNYTLSGVAARLLAGRVLLGSPGVYVLSGVAAKLLAGRVLLGSPGAYVLSGAAAQLIYTPLGPAQYVMNANPGSYALTGAAALTQATRLLTAAAGAYALTGAAAGLATGTPAPPPPPVVADTGGGGEKPKGRRRTRLVLQTDAVRWTYAARMDCTGAPGESTGLAVQQPLVAAVIASVGPAGESTGRAVQSLRVFTARGRSLAAGYGSDGTAALVDDELDEILALAAGAGFFD